MIVFAGSVANAPMPSISRHEKSRARRLTV
jgi:hypothetical protein